MRYLLSLSLILVCLAGVVTIFWHQEYRYSLPTPVPSDYRPIAIGTKVNLEGNLPKGPAFLHFYNPDCPCSRFNSRHVKELIRAFSDSVELLIVVPSDDALRKAEREFGEDLQYLSDPNRNVSRAYGVYSTPQAVIIDREGKLFYKGNYNKSRYCTNKATNYAELALLALLNNERPPVFDELATVAYGCSLEEESEVTFAKLFFK